MACDDLNTFNDFSSYLWCKIGDVHFGVVYRSPNATQENNTRLNELLSLTEKRRCVIVGDFNYPDINWKNSSAGAQGCQFHECVQDFFLYQHVDAPTRGGNILDLILSTEQNMVTDVEVVESLGCSDHNGIEFSVITQVSLKESKESVPDFRRANFQALRCFFSAIEWREVLKEKNVEDQRLSYSQLLLNAYAKCIPRC